MPLQFPNIDISPISFDQANPFLTGVGRAGTIAGQYMRNAYLPQTLQSEIFGREFSPLAQIASNPTAMAMMQDQGAGIMKLISQLLQQQGVSATGTPGILGGGGSQTTMGGGGNGITPRPTNSGGGGIYGGTSTDMSNAPSGGGNTGVNTGGTTDVNTPTMNTQPQSTSNLPSGQNVAQQLVAHGLAPAHTQLYPAGTPYIDKDGTIHTTESATLLSSDQVGEAAAQSISPLMNEIEKEGDNLLDDKVTRYNKSKIAAVARALGGGGLIPDKAKQKGFDPQYYDDYNQFLTNVKDASTKLNPIYSYGDTLSGHAQALSQLMPYDWEDAKSYHNRIENEKRKIAYQNELYKVRRTGGTIETPGSGISIPYNPFPDTGNKANTPVPAQQNANVPPSGNNSDLSFAKKFLSYKHNGKDDFREAFRSLSPSVRRQVRALMNAGGA
jgi:hypothetical protein